MLGMKPMFMIPNSVGLIHSVYTLHTNNNQHTLTQINTKVPA